MSDSLLVNYQEARKALFKAYKNTLSVLTTQQEMLFLDGYRYKEGVNVFVYCGGHIIEHYVDKNQFCLAIGNSLYFNEDLAEQEDFLFDMMSKDEVDPEK